MVITASPIPALRLSNCKQNPYHLMQYTACRYCCPASRGGIRPISYGHWQEPLQVRRHPADSTETLASFCAIRSQQRRRLKLMSPQRAVTVEVGYFFFFSSSFMWTAQASAVLCFP